VVGKYLFFTADDGAHGEELWKLDTESPDASASLVEDLWPGPEGAEPHELQATGPTSGVFIYRTDHGQQLMRVDTEGGKVALTPYPRLKNVP